MEDCAGSTHSIRAFALLTAGAEAHDAAIEPQTERLRGIRLNTTSPPVSIRNGKAQESEFWRRQRVICESTLSARQRLLLFVLVDGWQLVAGSLMTGVIQPEAAMQAASLAAGGGGP